MKVLFIDGAAEGRIEKTKFDTKLIRIPIRNSDKNFIVDYRIFQMHTTHETFGLASCEEKTIEDAFIKLFEIYHQNSMIVKG
jgi:hypothetical protein